MRKILLGWLLICSGLAYSQERVTEFPVDATYFAVDNLGFLYVTKGDQLTKYNWEGKSIFVYSDKLLGPITAVDASNPMKLLLYYRDLTQIAFLDNQLTIRGEPVVLDEMGKEQTLLSCTSHTNGFWIYDNFSFELTRYDQELREDRSTGNLVQILRQEINPVLLFEENNWVYLFDPALGMLVFDIYGTYLKTIPLPADVSDIHFRENQLIYRTGQTIHMQDLRTQEEKTHELPDVEFRQFLTTEKHWYLLTDDQLLVYSNPL